MAKKAHAIIESRNYNLPKQFPVLLLTGDIWRISDVPSGVLHFHNCLEIGMCESGSGTMKFSSSEHHFRENMITVVATDVPHTTYSDPGTSSKWTYLFLDVEELLTSYFPLNLFIDVESFNRLLHTYYGFLSKENYPDIYNLVTMIVTELIHKENHFELTVRGLVLSLVTKLVNIIEADTAGLTEHGKDHSRNQMIITPALDYIRKNYTSDFSIDDLAIACNMSSTHFRRTFTEIMGMAPLAYLNHYRINQASILLQITALPILEISETVGFRTVSSFNRQFLDIMGTNPMKWRKEMSYVQDRSIFKYSGWMAPPSN